MNFVDETEEQLAQATELLNQALDAIPDYDRNMELIYKIEAFWGLIGIEPDGEEEEDDEDD